MLTMGKPIQPKSIRPVGTLNEMFGERIRANYEQMREHINPMEILHFLSAAPEVYVAESGMTMLVNQENSAEIQNRELSLINNVLNRILISGHLAFTYQDRVFVENILQKLGVADVREWMRQVRMIKEEIRNVRELLSLYESGRDVIRLIGEYRREYLKQEKTGERAEDGQEKTEVPEAADRLATVVFHRLQTEKIYRETAGHAFMRIGDRTTINRQELSFGEQSIAAAYLTLNDYRSRLFARREGFVYHRADQYEIWNISRTDETYGQTVNSLLQTALLNAVRQLFHIRFQEFTRTPDGGICLWTLSMCLSAIPAKDLRCFLPGHLSPRRTGMPDSRHGSSLRERRFPVCGICLPTGYRRRSVQFMMRGMHKQRHRIGRRSLSRIGRMRIPTSYGRIIRIRGSRLCRRPDSFTRSGKRRSSRSLSVSIGRT